MPKGQLIPRNLDTKVITRFKGISQYKNIMQVKPDEALDLRNVIIAPSGQLSKFRVPTNRTTQEAGKIRWFVDFQAPDGRVVIGVGLNVVGVNLILWQPNYVGVVEQVPWTRSYLRFHDVFYNSDNTSSCQLDRNLYFGNGLVMKKMNGIASLMDWGIPKPVAAPTLGVSGAILNISRNANVTTINTNPLSPFFLQCRVGDTVKVSGVGDLATGTTFDGSFKVATTPSVGRITIAQVGGNVGSSSPVGATIFIYSSILDGTTDATLGVTGAFRFNNAVTFNIGDNRGRIRPGDAFTAVNCSDASFNGNFICTTVGSASVTAKQVGADTIPIGSGTPIGMGGTAALTSGFTNQVGGRLWRYAYKNPVTGHVGPASDAIGPISNNGGLITNGAAVLTPTAPDDTGHNSIIVWYATEDGGGDFFKHSEVTIAPPTLLGVLYDNKPDNLLDFTTRASFINFPPAVGDKIVTFQNRIFVAGGSATPGDIWYSGFDQILTGLPAESFPPFNRLRLQFGAGKIAAFGVIMPGVVAWSDSNEMYMFKGLVEDITVDAPVNFSAQLEQLPWQTGNASHDGTQSTPYGVVWVGSDHVVHQWNGLFYGEIIGPRDISENIHPLMRSITPNTDNLIRSAFFNFLDRDWYCVSLCINGSTVNNVLVFFDLTPNQAANAGIFIADARADYVTVREDPFGGRHLLVSDRGFIKELKIGDQTQNGITQNIDSTTDKLDAWWESGYDGTDNPTAVRMYRFGHVLADNAGFNVLVSVVDHNQGHGFDNPFQVMSDLKQGGKFTINHKGRMGKVRIIFPMEDINCAVQSLDWSSIPCSQR